MLGSLRAHRTTFSPLIAVVFLVGLLLAGAGSAHAIDPASSDDPYLEHPEAEHHHPSGHSEPADRSAPDHDDHGCDICLCYAAAGACSVPALSGEIPRSADAPVLRARTLAAPIAPPGSAPPHDIFHPPQG